MKHWIIALLLMPALALTGCNTDLLPQVLASDTQNIVEDVKEENTNVFGEIQHNINLVTELKAKVQDAQIDGKTISLNSIINDIETVAESYERLAGQRDDIRKEILGKVKKVENMQVTVDAEVVILRERTANYMEQLRLLSDPNPEIVRTRQKALSKAVEYVDAQIQLWQEFSKVERDIVIEMSDIQQTIDSFLSMIESSAILFREGLNLLYLQRDINEAIALFASDIPRMEQLTQDMEKSWENLDYLLSTLTGMANINIAQ